MARDWAWTEAGCDPRGLRVLRPPSQGTNPASCVKIILDQNITEYVRDLLPGHSVKHASEMGWSRISNGDLLDAAERAGFEVLLTADQNLKFQQNLTGRRIAILVLSTNRWPTIEKSADRILLALEGLAPGGYVEVALPRPRLRRRPPPGPRAG